MQERKHDILLTALTRTLTHTHTAAWAPRLCKGEVPHQSLNLRYHSLVPTAIGWLHSEDANPPALRPDLTGMYS